MSKRIQTHLFLFDRKRFRNLRNKKVTLRVYCIQQMENTSLLTPFDRRSSLKFCCADVDLNFTVRGDIQCLQAVTGGSDIWATVV